MRHTFGGFWVCLALLGLGACSSAAPPPAEGKAQLNFSGCNYVPASIVATGGSLQPDSYAGTVLDGQNGYHVSCTISGSGTYKVLATIESPDMRLTVQGSGVSAGTSQQVTMDFTRSAVNGNPGTLGDISSSACTLTITGGDLTIKPGSIYAQYSCTDVVNPQNLQSSCTTSGIFLFTGCNE
jgi:hypothetical protein